ncbi:MAG: NAD(P)H-dependent oxidoreductase [Candidatus Pacebacteria bacterium]|nr:NAD(P)H-dependent oxidoreductase [Candidatus Paceibacterota bacterium]MBP9831929.1 NAD(P)H-dependent oxidoreductase [Candidatus Paceibacterota bacterium]
MSARIGDMTSSKKKIFILMGNPDSDSRTGHLADAYELGALEAGHEVKRQNVGEMHFDPILHKGYKVIQELEPDLKTFQENVRWADHLVVLYPNWWSTMPALLKGLIDRAWLPGFAFRFHKTDVWWDGLLKGKSARIIILANTHPWFAWLMFGEFTNELARATLAFSGIAPIFINVLTPSEKVSETKWKKWVQMVQEMGRQAK